MNQQEKRLIAYEVGGYAPELRRADFHRAWIEEMPYHFAYRCLPLVIASQCGWDAINPVEFTATWNGRPEPDAISFAWSGSGNPGLACAHFGHGVLTFHLSYLFRTPPGIGLLVTGPPNLPKDGISPLSGIVESDWSPATFTMNYVFTRAHFPVRFHAGEPYCRLIPVDRRLVEQMSPEIRLVSDDPQLESLFQTWSRERNQFNKDLKIPNSEAAKEKWQRDYHAGRSEWGAPEDHQRKLEQQEFVDLRPLERRQIPIQVAADPTRPFSMPKVPEDQVTLMGLKFLNVLTPKERIAILSRYCAVCGSEIERCKCSRR